MDESDTTHLDLEFKRYLQLLRPYLGQLDDENIIKICDAWIKRLSDCKEEEKPLRNKYVLALCFQLANGILELPFINRPPAELKALGDDTFSDNSSVEMEFLVINSDEAQPNITFERKKITSSATEHLHFDDPLTKIRDGNVTMKSNDTEVWINSEPQTSFNTYPFHNMDQCECKLDLQYETRANNLVQKLREIKIQNTLLHKELTALREESQNRQDLSIGESIIKVENATSAMLRSISSNVTLNSLKSQLQDVQDSRKILIQTISQLQDKLDNFNELKKNEIDEILAQHNMELIKLRTTIREETKHSYDNKLDALKNSYEEKIKRLHDETEKENKEVNTEKNDIIEEKNKQLEMKDAEIAHLKSQLEQQKSSLHSVLTKLIEKPKAHDETTSESIKIRAQQLEKRLIKTEKSKAKVIKMFETKLAQLQREKHLIESSMQLQLVRQRAQVVSDLTEESQQELNSSLDKLETKYKNIVANVQATALQRRMQDQLALETIIQTACSINKSYRQSHEQNPEVKNQNQTYDTEISTIMRGNKVGNITNDNKSYTDDSLLGYYLNGVRMGDLFDRVYIPQRDGATK